MKKNIYSVTGRHMKGNEVIKYQLYNNLTNKSRAVSKEQLVYLIGKGEVNNCRCQFYKDDVLIRGLVNLTELPVYDLNKRQIRNLSH